MRPLLLIMMMLHHHNSEKINDELKKNELHTSVENQNSAEKSLTNCKSQQEDER